MGRFFSDDYLNYEYFSTYISRISEYTWMTRDARPGQAGGRELEGARLLGSVKPFSIPIKLLLLLSGLVVSPRCFSNGQVRMHVPLQTSMEVWVRRI